MEKRVGEGGGRGEGKDGRERGRWEREGKGGREREKVERRGEGERGRQREKGRGRRERAYRNVWYSYGCVRPFSLVSQTILSITVFHTSG